jgi:hypothetical protein
VSWLKNDEDSPRSILLRYGLYSFMGGANLASFFIYSPRSGAALDAGAAMPG